MCSAAELDDLGARHRARGIRRPWRAPAGVRSRTSRDCRGQVVPAEGPGTRLRRSDDAPRASPMRIEFAPADDSSSARGTNNRRRPHGIAPDLPIGCCMSVVDRPVPSIGGLRPSPRLRRSLVVLVRPRLDPFAVAPQRAGWQEGATVAFPLHGRTSVHPRGSRRSRSHLARPRDPGRRGYPADRGPADHPDRDAASRRPLALRRHRTPVVRLLGSRDLRVPPRG